MTENNKENGFNFELWLSLLNILFNNSSKSDNDLEKEVAYLHGKLDTLEKIVIDNK